MQYTYVRGVYLREASDRPESALKWREKPERHFPFGRRYQLRGEDQIFPGICGLIFHENPIFREAFIHEILFHGRRFRAWFIAALTAGDNEDSIWIFKGICVCTVETECQRAAGTSGTYVRAKYDDVVKTGCRSLNGHFYNHSFHTGKEKKRSGAENHQPCSYCTGKMGEETMVK